MRSIAKTGPDRYLARAVIPEDGPPWAVIEVVHNAGLHRHDHDFHELVLVRSGSGEHVTDDDTWPVARGDVFFLRSGERHGYRGAEDLRLVNLLLDTHRFVLTIDDLGEIPGFHALFRIEPSRRREQSFDGRLRLGGDDLDRALALVDALVAEGAGGEPGSVAQSRFLLGQLIVFLSRAYEGQRAPAARESLRLGAALAFMEQHSHQSLAIDGLALRAGLSPRHFHRLFKAAMGVSPLDYQQRLRIEHAKRLLADPRRAVTEVALAVGYADASYFARQFRRATGISPRRWRQQPVQTGGVVW